MLIDLVKAENVKKKQQEFEQAVHESPQDIGYHAPVWTPALVNKFLEEAYDVEYSLPSCRRLLK